MTDDDPGTADTLSSDAGASETEAAPAAVAVALAGSQNVCWDAGECRLRYAWQGAFIDASANWAGNGNKLAALSATPWWQAPKGSLLSNTKRTPVP